MEMAKALNTPVPQNQWDMPAGFRPNGQMAILIEVVDPKIPTLSLREISPAQRAELVIKRIEQQSDFKIAVVAGRALMEIE